MDEGASELDRVPWLRWMPVVVSLSLLAVTLLVAAVEASRDATLVLTATLPALLAATAVGYAYRVGVLVESPEGLRIVLEWLITGVATMALIGVWFAFTQWLLGVSLPPGIAVLTIITAGGLLGLLIGRYSVRARLKVAEATQARVEREYAERRQERIALLNRILRHHMRNAVNVIEASAVEARKHVGEGAEGHLDVIEDRAREVNDTVEVFQRVAETLAEADRLDSRDLGAVLRRELERARERYPGAEFRADDLPERTHVRANDLLGTVIHSQLENAVQHNDRETPVVEVDVEENADHALLRVADNGPGVPDHEKEVIFEAGDRGVTTEGDGLELFLTRSVLDRYGGTIRVEDNDPRGAVFETEFPRAGADALGVEGRATTGR